MSPEPSWTDRILPDWMGGSSEPAGAGTEMSGEPTHVRLVSRIEQLREGTERAAAALPDEDGSLGRQAVEAADELTTRARAAVERAAEEAVPALREGGRALHEAHFLAVKIRVARDQGETEGAGDARAALESVVQEVRAAAGSLEELATGR